MTSSFVIPDAREASDRESKRKFKGVSAWFRISDRACRPAGNDRGKERTNPISYEMRRRALGFLMTLVASGAGAKCVALAEDKMLSLSPRPPAQPSETHAALALAPGVYATDLHFAGRVATLGQLRTGSAPNPWECAWLVWNYSDNDHFYYLALKPNGWELGKRDPAYPGGQRFLAAGESSFAIGAWAAFSIAQRENEITVAVNNATLATVVDSAPPIYKSGRIGVYAEDATVALDDLTSPLIDDFDAHETQCTATDESSVAGWRFPFLGHGAASITPVEGGAQWRRANGCDD
jgi:hypothetical protein